MVWQCNRKYGEKLHCDTPHLTEEWIQQAFIQAFNLLLEKKERLLAELDSALQALADTAVLDKEIIPLQVQLGDILTDIQALVKQNASTAQDQKDYARQYDELTAGYKVVKERLDVLMAEKQERCVQQEKLRRFCGILRNTAMPLASFDARLWCMAAESVTVYSMSRAVVHFSGGTRVEIAIDG